MPSACTQTEGLVSGRDYKCVTAALVARMRLPTQTQALSYRSRHASAMAACWRKLEAHPCHICTGTGLTHATSALGLGRRKLEALEAESEEINGSRAARQSSAGNTRSASVLFLYRLPPLDPHLLTRLKLSVTSCE